MSDTTPTARDFVIAICKTFEIKESELMHRSKEALPVIARQAMWTLMREHKYTLGQIGLKCGRDHSTVLSGLKRLQAAMVNSDIAAKVEAARKLVPEIAHRRAQGETFNLELAPLRPIAETRPQAAPAIPVRVPVVPKKAPVVAVRTAPDKPGDSFEMMQMRAHVRSADARFAEALKAELVG